MPAKHVLETHPLCCKNYWFREIYGLRVGASVDRNESYTKTIDGKFAASRLSSNQKGQRCLERQPQCVNPSVDGPSDVHSLEAIKIADSQSASEILRSHGLKTKTVAKAARRLSHPGNECTDYKSQQILLGEMTIASSTELDRRSLFSLCFWCLLLVWFCLVCCFVCCLFVCCVVAMESGLCTGLIPVHFCGSNQKAAVCMQ